MNSTDFPMSAQKDHRFKLDRLKENIARLDSLLIAFSGGVDSTFLLRVAKEVLGERVSAATAVSDLCLSQELESAERSARMLSVKHEMIQHSILSDPAFIENTPDHCYFCKKVMFAKFRALAERRGIGHVADGTNLDDLKDFRPGLRALEELGIVSPLKEALFTKADIRAASRELGLEVWNKPAMACLASRFPYGTPIAAPDLEKVRQAEELLQALGFGQFRVRHHGDTARIELSVADMERIFSGNIRAEIVKHLKGLGYRYVALDLEGYRTGSLNES